jgi:hypothetical protein
MTHEASRRAFLQLSAATAALSLAGCIDDVVRADIGADAPAGSEDAKLLAFFSKSFTIPTPQPNAGTKKLPPTSTT